MPDKPSLFPRWATDPGANVTEPSEGTKDDGWEPGNPALDYDNWLKLFTYLWLLWLDHTAGRPSMVWADDQISFAFTVQPGELSSNTWPASVDQSAGWFTGAAIIGGYFVNPIDSPATSATEFPAERDVYVDLGLDGVWDFNAVANGATAPALEADHVRFFVFVTNDSAQITDGVFFGAAYLENSTAIRFEGGAVVADGGVSWDGTGLQHLLHDGAVQSANGWLSPGAQAAKELLAGQGATVPAGLAGNSSHWWALAVNCRWTGSEWARTVDTDDAYLEVWHKQGKTILWHAASEAATWANTISGTTWTVVGQFGRRSTGLNNGNLEVDASGNVRCTGSVVCEAVLNGASVLVSGSLVSQSNPASTSQTILNSIHAKTMLKAWVAYTDDGAGGLSILDGINIAGIAWNGGASRVEITLAEPITGVPAVQATYNHNGLSNPYRLVLVQQVAGDRIDVQHYDVAGAALVDQTLTSHGVTYVFVYGVQTV